LTIFSELLHEFEKNINPFAINPTKMLSNASAIAAVFANSRVVVKPLTGEEGQFQGPLAGPDNSTQRHLVERMEDEGDDWATWQWKPL
jgi:hypothetical protein